MKLRSLVVLSLSGAAVAQSVSLSANVATSCVAVSGAQIESATLPAGPMPANGGLGAATAPPAASASFSWSSGASATGMHVGLSQACSLAAGGTVASCGLLDVRVELVAPVPMDVTLRVAKQSFVTAAVGAPLLRVDVGDDGTFEVTEAMAGTLYAFLTLGPVPSRVRVLMDAATTLPGHVTNALLLDVLPATNTQSVSVVAGCGFLEHGAQPRFDGNLDVYFGTQVLPFGVVVLGLSPQPVLLGILPHAACVLMPAPDLLVLALPDTTFTLNLPPAVRPVTIWTQAVGLEPAGLVTSPGFRVDAL